MDMNRITELVRMFGFNEVIGQLLRQTLCIGMYLGGWMFTFRGGIGFVIGRSQNRR